MVTPKKNSIRYSIQYTNKNELIMPVQSEASFLTNLLIKKKLKIQIKKNCSCSRVKLCLHQVDDTKVIRSTIFLLVANQLFSPLHATRRSTERITTEDAKEKYCGAAGVYPYPFSEHLYCGNHMWQVFWFLISMWRCYINSWPTWLLFWSFHNLLLLPSLDPYCRSQFLLFRFG